MSPLKKPGNVVDRLTGGGRGEKLEKMIEKKKLEFTHAKADGVIDEEDLEDVL
jgi:hypothetical protein